MTKRSSMLSVDLVREMISYDPETGVLRWKGSPSNNVPAGSVTGCKNDKGYLTVRIRRRPYQAHRLAWLIVHGVWPIDIDHIDGDRTNNRLLNLREATNTQNQANKPCRGFFYSQSRKRFGAALRRNGTKVFLGYFDTAEQAQAAYRAAHAKQHGEFSFTHRIASGQAAKNAARLSAASPPGAQR